MRSDTPRSFALTVGSQWESCLPTCTVQHPPVLTRPQGSWSHAVTSWYLLSVSMVSKRLFSQYQLGGSKTKQCVMWAPTDRVSLSPRWMAWRYRHEMSVSVPYLHGRIHTSSSNVWVMFCQDAFSVEPSCAKPNQVFFLPKLNYNCRNRKLRSEHNVKIISYQFDVIGTTPTGS